MSRIIKDVLILFVKLGKGELGFGWNGGVWRITQLSCAIHQIGSEIYRVIIV